MEQDVNQLAASIINRAVSRPQVPGEPSVAFDPPLDPDIAGAVQTLRDGGIETFESCGGGADHAYAEPTIRFHGDRSEGFRALAVAIRAGLNIADLRRVWPVVDGEPTGPWWEITIRQKQEVDSRLSGAHIGNDSGAVTPS